MVDGRPLNFLRCKSGIDCFVRNNCYETLEVAQLKQIDIIKLFLVLFIHIYIYPSLYYILDENNFTLLGSLQRHRFWMGCAQMPTSPGRSKIWTLSLLHQPTPIVIEPPPHPPPPYTHTYRPSPPNYDKGMYEVLHEVHNSKILFHQ